MAEKKETFEEALKKLEDASEKLKSEEHFSRRCDQKL